MSRAAGRLDGLGTTIFTEMTALALRAGAINLGQVRDRARSCWRRRRFASRPRRCRRRSGRGD